MKARKPGKVSGRRTEKSLFEVSFEPVVIGILRILEQAFDTLAD